MFLRETGLFSFKTHPVSVTQKQPPKGLHITVHCVSRDAAYAALMCLVSLSRDADWQVLDIHLSTSKVLQTVLTLDIEGATIHTLKPMYLVQQLDEVAGLLQVHCNSR